MAATASITFHNQANALIAKVRCDSLDYMVIDRLQRRIGAQATMAGKYNVIVDLSEVDRVPSLVMGALVKLLQRLTEEGRKFILVGMSRHIRASFKVTRIDILFPIHDTVRDALQALNPKQCD